MPVAVLRNDDGEERRFEVAFCPVHVLYRDHLWALQAGQPMRPNEWLYRQSTTITLLDAQRVDIIQAQAT